MISIVTGTLNRLNFLPSIIDNTVNSNKNLELVLVDGGSTDGTIEYIKKINHPQIKLIEVGGRSSYPHFMNLGIENSKYEYICQWNDDVLLINNWNDVINEIDKEYDFYLFNWKYGNIEDYKNEGWIKGHDHKDGWFLLDTKYENSGSIIMNYGIYNKNIFKKIGLYNDDYLYYYADSDMSERSYYFGFKHKTLRNIKVLSINTIKNAKHSADDLNIFNKNVEFYKNRILPEKIKKLK